MALECLPAGARPRAAPAAAALGLLLATLLATAPARADIPTPVLLEQIKARMHPPRARGRLFSMG